MGLHRGTLGTVDVGAILIVVGLVLLIPAFLTGGMALAGILGWSLKSEAEVTHEGSELIELNR